MRAEWTPLFWEPVEGTGERLMAGVVLHYNGTWTAQRVLRDDVLDSLYGSAAANPRSLIDEALRLCISLVEVGGLEAITSLQQPLMGLHAGKSRTTDAISTSDALRQAVLLHASLAQLDGLDEAEDVEAVPAEEVNKRFTTEVRESVLKARPDLAGYFGRTAQLITNGAPVRFGYLSPNAVLHFSVLHPVRQASSVRFARAKLWELYRARDVSSIASAALVTAVPREDDPTLGNKQRKALLENRVEIEQEADAVGMRLYPVVSVEEAVAKVLEVA
jgi:hypothetical protein